MLIFSLTILIASITYISRKHLSKLKKTDIDNIDKNYPRDLEEVDAYDSYMVIYFQKDCNYTEFYNIYRKKISFIFNKANNTNLTSRTALVIHKGFGIEIHFDIAVQNLEYFFSRGLDQNMEYLESIDFTKFDSSLVTKMDNMFYGCNSLKSIILPNLNISKVESMDLMFYGCSALQSINLSNLKGSKLHSMSEMFSECKSLKNVNFSNFDCPLIFSMSNIFFGCSLLESIDFSNFHTPLLFDMYNMFYGCSSLKSIDLSDFDTSQVSIMNNMFYGCSSLRALDLSNFDMNSCTSYDNIFSSISNIRYINLYNFKNDKIMSHIFSEKNNSLFVCQKDNIIKNPNAYNCCDFNFEADKCNSYKIYNENNSDISEDNNPGNFTNPTSLKNNSSSKITIGVIIGIIVGIIVVIAIVTAIICICIKKPAIVEPDKNTTIVVSDTNAIIVEPDTNTTNSIFHSIDTSNIYEYEPEVPKENKIPIIIETTSQIKVQILIDPNKTMVELIKYYFKVIGKKDLFNDQSIRFILNANLITHNSKDLINNYIKKETKVYTIIVDDLEDKIKPK